MTVKDGQGRQWKQTRCVTLIDGVFQLKTESFKPQAVKKALTVLLLSCQHHLISTEQITCASLTNLISLFFFFSSSLWRFPQPYALFRQKTPWSVLNPRFDGWEFVSELSWGADIGWAPWSMLPWVHLPDWLRCESFCRLLILSWGIFLSETLRETVAQRE